MRFEKRRYGEVVRPVRWPLVWQVLLAGLVAGAVVWWWNMPHGYPPSHPRFWVNQVLPFVLVALGLTGSRAIERGRAGLCQALLLTLPIGAAAALVAGIYLFPLSTRRFWLPGTAAVLALEFFWVWSCQPRAVGRAVVFCVGLISAAIGAGAVYSQRGPDADTSPVGLAAPIVDAALDVVRPPSKLELSANWGMRPSDGTLLGTVGRLNLELQPLLWFESISPDRCWTILAPRRMSLGPGRTLEALDADQGFAAAHYASPLKQTLVARDDGPLLEVEAFTELEAPIYSHLNSLCELHVRGQRKLSLRFSPCPNVEIDVLPADYPTGRPARTAVLLADGTFRVVEARTGEKGPFKTLASGKLERGEPLAITLCDEGEPQAVVTLTDFARQADRQLSPTAGWGLPVNALEFSSLGDTESSPAALWITLSGTSIGRGWDSVGHTAGIYRNQVTIEAAEKGMQQPAAPAGATRE